MMIGGMDVGVFKEAGRRYDIRMRLEEEDRTDPEAIGRLYVRNAKDGRRRAAQPRRRRDRRGALGDHPQRPTAQRDHLRNLEGKTLGEAIAEATRRSPDRDPARGGVTLEPRGRSQAMQESVQQFGSPCCLGILVIYMVLAAQFESLVHPLTVMLALPLAMVGASAGSGSPARRSTSSA